MIRRNRMTSRRIGRRRALVILMFFAGLALLHCIVSRGLEKEPRSRLNTLIEPTSPGDVSISRRDSRLTPTPNAEKPSQSRSLFKVREGRV